MKHLKRFNENLFDEQSLDINDDLKSNFSKSSEIALEVSDENDRTGAIPLEWEKPPPKSMNLSYSCDRIMEKSRIT